MEVRQKAPSAEGAVSRRLTEDNLSPCPQARLARPRRLCQPPWTQPISRNPRPLRMGAQVRRNVQVYSHPLFGREGSGGRGASLREAASPPQRSSPSRLFGRGPGERGFSTEKPPPPEFFLCISLYFSWFLLDGMEGTWYDAKQFHRRDESPPRKAMKSSSSRGASLAESREKVQVRQGEPVKEQLGASARKAQAK